MSDAPRPPAEIVQDLEDRLVALADSGKRLLTVPEHAVPYVRAAHEELGSNVPFHRRDHVACGGVCKVLARFWAYESADGRRIALRGER
jgi:hypothetical protein